MTELATWLEKHGLGQFAQVLAENDIDFDVFPSLTEDDLKELGLSIGHRRRFLNALQKSALKLGRSDAAQAERVDDQESADRRQLTVMFCDLVGSTELSEKLDPEDMRSVLGQYHNTVANTVSQHEGHVAKLLGDGVLAYFGWPQAHEAAAEVAVRAALAAVSAVGEHEVAGEPLAARVGIATGSVVIGDMIGESAQERGAVVGSTPNLAARLQALAQPGEVAINDGTRRLIGAAFDLEDRGAHALKGFEDPIPVWRVSGVGSVVSRFDALHGSGLTDFVGRTHEIGLLEDRWRQAQNGEGQVVLLSGEAGIGKSRIMREFALARTAEERQILRYQCSPHEVHAAFHPIVTELSAAAGFLPNDPPELRLDKLETHLGEIFEELDEAAPLFACLLSLPRERYPPIEMGPQRRKQRTVALLSERVARLATEQPVLILAEDLHWADPSSIEALDAVIERTQELPVLVVATTRPEYAPEWDGHGHVTLHSLNRLGHGDGRAIAEAVAVGKALPKEVLERIVMQTDGIPLFVEELTKTVLESGLLEERNDRYVLTGPLPDLAIPSTLQDSLMARLDRLAPVRQVIQAAACIGREFDAGLLSAAVAMDSDSLDDALDQLVEAQLIFRRTGVAEERYIFKHALVQDAAYASLLKSSRQPLHARLARALEETRDPDALELARHHFAAGAYERSAGLFLSAGQKLLEASAVAEAIGALEQGLVAMQALPPSRDRDRLELDIRIALGAGRMANFGWAHPSVSEAFEPAYPLARSFGDNVALASILWGLWVHYQTRTNFPQAHEWLSELRTVAGENSETDLPVVYDMSAGCQYFWEADYEHAVVHTDHLKEIYVPERHARIASLTNHDPLVFSQHWAGSLAEWIRGYPDRSIERLDEAVSLARKIGHPFNLMFALTAGATALIYRGEADRLLEFCDEAEKVVTEEALGQFSMNVCVYQWRGAARIQQREFGIGHSLAVKGNEYWTMSGGGICTAMMRSWIVLGLQGLGRIDEALGLNAGNITHCRETGDRYMEPECIRLQGELMLRVSDPDLEAAEHFFREAVTIAGAHDAKSWELRAAMSLADLLGSRDRHKDAIACLEPVLGWFTEGLETADLRRACALLCSLA
ncbi:MAG: AAA family ATPase [Alphaproteobacteria bacterium]|nr:AAA family ATPase [Alphaproteobacteria bacterium]